MTDLEPFRVVVADPPWRFSDGLGRRGAAHHYATMRVEDICNFALPAIAPDAFLFLWRVASMPDLALRVVRAWGFEVKSEIIWVKLTKHGKRHMGMGRFVRAEHEACLLATRGRPTRLSCAVRSTFAAGVGRHSEKPEAFFELVERLCPGPYVELFARRHRRGWAAVGDQLPAAAVG